LYVFVGAIVDNVRSWLNTFTESGIGFLVASVDQQLRTMLDHVSQLAET